MGRAARANPRNRWLKSLPPDKRRQALELELILSRIRSDLHRQLDELLAHPDNGPSLVADVVSGKGMVLAVHTVDPAAVAGTPVSPGEPASKLVDADGKPLTSEQPLALVAP